MAILIVILNMKNISTDSLRTFVMVVEASGFAKAGDLLGLSQPAVSLQIEALRRFARL